MVHQHSGLLNIFQNKTSLEAPQYNILAFSAQGWW